LNRRNQKSLKGVVRPLLLTSGERRITNEKDQELLSKSIGKPSIGGPFNLTSQDFQSFTEKDLLGNWTLIYFGFTNCPDICPEELDKMGQAVEMVDAARKERVLPMFISVDPARDGVKEVKKYIMGESPSYLQVIGEGLILDFHPRMVGLTGDYESVKRACKSYRVYFSTPPDAKPTEDYLVDHRYVTSFLFTPDDTGKEIDIQYLLLLDGPPRSIRRCIRQKHNSG
jgi:protein SCO1/2